MPIDVSTVADILDFDAELKLQGFKVFAIDSRKNIVCSYNRKDFYKICVITGHHVIHYAGKGFEVQGTTLFFGNPLISYSWENITEQTGYTCLFSKTYLMCHGRSESLQESPLFKIRGIPVFLLNDRQREFVEQLFQQMLAEQDTTYQYRHDLIRNYINLIIHEALKMQAGETSVKHNDASSRIAIQFLEMLERQFTIKRAGRPIQLKTAQGFADQLSVHVNHLNRAVKQVTGKTTTTHISERIIMEARTLLHHTDWPVAEIAYALGFRYPSHFTNFFKKMTGYSPSELRP